MWELDKEGWALKNRCFQTVVLEKTLENPLHSKMIKPVNPKGNQPWIFLGKTVAEVPILWLPDVKSQFAEKDRDAGKDWGQEEKEATDNEMAGWHHQLNGHVFQQTPGDSEGEGSLVCCSPWGQKVRHDWMTAQHKPYIIKSFHVALPMLFFHSQEWIFLPTFYSTIRNFSFRTFYLAFPKISLLFHR